MTNPTKQAYSHLTSRQPAYSGDFIFTADKSQFSLPLDHSNEKTVSLHFRENGKYQGSIHAEPHTENLLFAVAETHEQEIILDIHLLPHSSLTLVLHLSLAKEGTANVCIQTNQERNSNFHLVLLQNSQGNSHLTVKNILQEKSHADIHILSIQKDISRSSIAAEIQATAGECSGSIVERAVLFDESLCKIQGNPHICKGASFSSLELEQKTLLMGEGARVISQPQLFVSNNEVHAKHSASIATLSEEDRFYLMSRGLSEENAKELIIDAFIHSLFEKIPSENIQNCLIENVKQFISA